MAAEPSWIDEPRILGATRVVEGYHFLRADGTSEHTGPLRWRPDTDCAVRVEICDPFLAQSPTAFGALRSEWAEGPLPCHARLHIQVVPDEEDDPVWEVRRVMVQAMWDPAATARMLREIALWAAERYLPHVDPPRAALTEGVAVLRDHLAGRASLETLATAHAAALAVAEGFNGPPGRFPYPTSNAAHAVAFALDPRPEKAVYLSGARGWGTAGCLGASRLGPEWNAAAEAEGKIQRAEFNRRFAELPPWRPDR